MRPETKKIIVINSETGNEIKKTSPSLSFHLNQVLLSLSRMQHLQYIISTICHTDIEKDGTTPVMENHGTITCLRYMKRTKDGSPPCQKKH